jgi:hypothetical protein
LEHFADHLPSDRDIAVLDEVAGHVQVVLIKGDFEGELVKFKPIVGVVARQPEETLNVAEDNLDVGRCHRHIICHRKDNLEHMFIVVADTPVEVEQCLVWIFFQIGGQRLHLFMAQGDLGARVFLL